MPCWSGDGSGSEQSSKALRPLDRLGWLWSAAAVAPVAGGAAAADPDAVHDAAADGGRPPDGGTAGRGRPDADGDGVRLPASTCGRCPSASSAECALRPATSPGANRFDAAAAVLHNVHLRPSAPPGWWPRRSISRSTCLRRHSMTCSCWAAPRLSGTVGADSVARLQLVRRPGWAASKSTPQLDGSTLWLQPRGLTLRRKRWSLPGGRRDTGCGSRSCPTDCSSPSVASRRGWCGCREPSRMADGHASYPAGVSARTTQADRTTTQSDADRQAAVAAHVWAGVLANRSAMAWQNAGRSRVSDW